MKRTLLSPYAPKRKRRGAQLLEFAITLPLFLFMLLLSLDMSRMLFISGVIHDAAFTSARAGAQVGAAGNSSGGASRTAFYEAVDSIPGSNPNDATFRVAGSTICRKSPSVNGSENFVEVKVTYKVRFISPGLSSALGIMQGNRTNPDGSWTLPATGIARCEVVRG